MNSNLKILCPSKQFQDKDQTHSFWAATTENITANMPSRSDESYKEICLLTLLLILT